MVIRYIVTHGTINSPYACGGGARYIRETYDFCEINTDFSNPDIINIVKTEVAKKYDYDEYFLVAFEEHLSKTKIAFTVNKSTGKITYH